MTHILIDPYTLVFNSEKDSSIELFDYINRILDTVEISDYQFIKPFISDNTTHLLMSENDYPEWSFLSDELKRHGLHKKFHPKDIFNAIEGILKLSTIEDYISVKDILFELLDFTPSNTYSIAKAYLSELERLYVFCHLNKIKNGDTYLMGLNEGENSLSGILLEIEADGFDIELPFTFEETLKTISTLENVLKSVDYIKVWKESISTEEITEAIKLFILQQQIQDTKLKWSLGDKFLKNLRTYGFYQEDSKINGLLLAMSEVISETNQSKSHALRETIAGNSPQKVGQHGNAIRHDIDYEYHLHYWKQGNNIIFSSVVKHNDFSIL